MICVSAAKVLRASISALVAISATGFALSAKAQTAPVFSPGNLVVSRSVYTATSGSVVVGQTLPPGCVPIASLKVTCGVAVANGTYPAVFQNAIPDGSFGITSPIFLDQMSLTGTVLNTLQVPNSSTVTSGDQLVTSFSSKSEEGLHLSTDGKQIAFIDYVAPLNTIDVSNANTPAVIDPSDPVVNSFYRAAATVDAQGQFTFTETNAYSGNNGRAAILVNSPIVNGTANSGPTNFFYTVGNAGNGANPEPKGVVLGAGVQFIQPANALESAQNPTALPTPLASFSVTQVLPVGAPNPDKVGKDDNFRGIALYNGVLYVTKGSGGNGVNTVYFVDTTGTACPSTGVGVPVPNAPLPNAATAAATTASYTTANGLANNMCILQGFPTTVIKNAPASTPLDYPFGLWFANPTTLYVADEGDGSTRYDAGLNLFTDAAGMTTPANTGGLQKWILNTTTNTWALAYTLTNGLKLGVPYDVPTPKTGPNAGIAYPNGLNSGTNGTGLPWTPATDGLRQIIGSVGGNRFTGPIAVIYAVSSTVSGNNDTGADPNKIYVITDRINNTSPAVAAQEMFTDLRDATSGEVLRGITFTPGTAVTSN